MGNQPSFNRGFITLPVLTTIIAVLALASIGYFGFYRGISAPTTKSSPIHDEVSTDTKDYLGSWFKISYPADFIAKPAIASGDFRAEKDEATFSSPDGSVEFFVYSPYAYGTTTYEEPLPTERIVSDTSKLENIQPDYLSPRLTRWVTFAAKDGSYMRSFVSIKEAMFDQPDPYGHDAQFHHVFGIKYKDQATYDRYLQQYLALKASLVQYAD